MAPICTSVGGAAMMRLRTRQLTVPALAAVVLVVAACGQTPQQPPARTVTLTPTHADGEPVPLGAALVMSDLAPIFIEQGTVTEFEPGWFMGPVAGVGADGTFTVRLPADADVPASTLAAPDDFLRYIDLDACTIHTSDPSAMVSKTSFDLASTPGMAVLTADGAWPGIVTDADFSDANLPEDLEDFAFITWLYADRPVTIGTGPHGAGLMLCEVAPDVVFGLSVDLRAGWNQLTWRLFLSPVSFDLIGFSLTNNAAEDLFLSQSLMIAAALPAALTDLEVTP